MGLGGDPDHCVQGAVFSVSYTLCFIMASGLEVSLVPRDRTAAALQRENALVIDCRSSAEYSSSHVKGAISLPGLFLEEQVAAGVSLQQAGTVGYRPCIQRG